LIALNWAFSLQFWLIFNGDLLRCSFFLVDVFTAAAFFAMSKERWFPAPLCFLHIALSIYHLSTTVIPESYYWIQAVLNRAFELEILYVICCATFRIVILRRAAAPKGF